MKIFEVDKRGKTPIYEYLYKCIRDEIREGRLKKGEKLPSKRNLASLYGISIITIENTYAQLLLEGYITSEQKKGYFVSDIAPISPFDKKILSKILPTILITKSLIYPLIRLNVQPRTFTN